MNADWSILFVAIEEETHSWILFSVTRHDFDDATIETFIWILHSFIDHDERISVVPSIQAI